MTSHIRAVGLLASLGLGSMLGGCAKDREEPEPTAVEPMVEVEVNYVVDLSMYTTFDIVNPTPSAMGEPPQRFLDLQTQLEDAIVAELGGKGLARDRTSPQLLVNPLVNSTRAGNSAEFYESAYGWYWGYDHMWTLDREYTEGSLVLDVVDRNNLDDVGDDLLVYRGAIQGLMAAESEDVEDLRDYIQTIFATWPDAQAPR